MSRTRHGGTRATWPRLGPQLGAHTNPLPNADWDEGGLLRQATLGSNLRDPTARDTADPWFFFSEGCVFTFSGSRLTEVAAVRATEQPKQLQ